VIAEDDHHDININLNKLLELEVNNIKIQANKAAIKRKEGDSYCWLVKARARGN